MKYIYFCLKTGYFLDQTVGTISSSRSEIFTTLSLENFRPICILSCPTIFGKISENFFTVYEFNSSYSLFLLC